MSRTRARANVQRSLRSAAARVPDVFAPGTRLVVGFSGGQDSTCLLHALARPRRGLDIVAAHVDHGLRNDSAADAQRVADLAQSLGVEVEVRRVDVGAYRKAVPGWSVQQAARAARYQALASIAQSCAAAAVLVAHTADDLVETLLLNLMRGSGLAGVAGMRMDETIRPARLGPRLAELAGLPDALRLVRPLLTVPRSTTSAYCAEFPELTLVEDASNQSRIYTRNRVRLDLLPVLETFNPAIRSVLARTADLAAEDIAALEPLDDQRYTSMVRWRAPDVREYDLRLWRAEPRALQRRLLRRGLESLLGGLVDVPGSPIEDALDVLQSATPAKAYHLPHGVELCILPSRFVLRLHGAARARRTPNTRDIEVSRV
ncbi:MAG: tRNA lysidine(34) synthetase TilS [Chloroflexota bacterium]|nr:tRNA lysidine(34) synthetase TilS [Chloroflexota bacterium]